MSITQIVLLALLVIYLGLTLCIMFSAYQGYVRASLEPAYLAVAHRAKEREALRFLLAWAWPLGVALNVISMVRTVAGRSKS